MSRIVSEATRARISETLKKRWADPTQRLGMRGKKHTALARARIAEAMSGKPKSAVHCAKMAAIFSGNGSGRWRGGTHIHCGYIKMWVGPRKYKKRANIVAEKALGRPLRQDELVHHINGNKLDDRNENLLVCTRSYHQWLHKRMEACAISL